MNQSQDKNPLQGVTLEAMLTGLVEKLGWEYLGKQIAVRCFLHDPSIKSSLVFLRRTPWARAKLEQLYLRTLTKGKAPSVLSLNKKSDRETVPVPAPVNPSIWKKT